MNVKVRYKDIPWEEVLEVHSMCIKYTTPADANNWAKYRGTEVLVKTPGIQNTCCGEIAYEVLAEGPQRIVCSHIAEIGD